MLTLKSGSKVFYIVSFIEPVPERYFCRHSVHFHCHTHQFMAHPVAFAVRIIIGIRLFSKKHAGRISPAAEHGKFVDPAFPDTITPAASDRIDRLPVNFHHTSNIIYALHPAFYFETVYTRVDEKLKVRQHAEVLRTHEISAPDVL